MIKTDSLIDLLVFFDLDEKKLLRQLIKLLLLKLWVFLFRDRDGLEMLMDR